MNKEAGKTRSDHYKLQRESMNIIKIFAIINVISS